MSKKITLHLDAICVILFLFILSIAGNFFLQSQLHALTKENEKLQLKGLENDFNLDAQAAYIKMIEQQLDKNNTD